MRGRTVRTFAIVTFGCKVNQYESQAIREQLAGAGYTEVAAADAADLCVVNTCAVTQATENECRRRIRKLAGHGAASLTLITGCLAELDSFAALEGRGNVIVVRKGEAARRVPLPSISDLTVSGHAGHVRAFLKIQDGCSAACSYCIVPRARGPSRSRPAAEVLSEAERLAQNGFQEIVLTGVHIGGYGKDLDGKPGLADLLRRLLDVKGVGRVRLGSLELNDLTDELLGLACSDMRICPHFHVPLQSGDDKILRRMNRAYSARDYAQRMEQVKDALLLPALTTDVIVGFPGESEAAFSNTVSLCRSVGFSRIHVFSFSSRPGTPAAQMGDRVAPHVVRKRKERLQEVAAELAAAYRGQMIGREADLLIEYGRDRNSGLLHGHTERYIGVLVCGPDEWARRIIKVRIAGAEEGHLRGETVSG